MLKTLPFLKKLRITRTLGIYKVIGCQVHVTLTVISRRICSTCTFSSHYNAYESMAFPNFVIITICKMKPILFGILKLNHDFLDMANSNNLLDSFKCNHCIANIISHFFSILLILPSSWFRSIYYLPGNLPFSLSGTIRL